MKIAGFTGTRKGMTDIQKELVTGLLTSVDIALHGGCVGADIGFDDICYRYKPRSIITVVRPSNIKRTQGRWHYTPCVKPEKPPLVRDKDIVDFSDFLIACPDGKEKLRSGTWATVRYARKQGKKIFIVYPDGTVSVEEGINKLSTMC